MKASLRSSRRETGILWESGFHNTLFLHWNSSGAPKQKALEGWFIKGFINLECILPNQVRVVCTIKTWLLITDVESCWVVGACHQTGRTFPPFKIQCGLQTVLKRFYFMCWCSASDVSSVISGATVNTGKGHIVQKFVMYRTTVWLKSY